MASASGILLTAGIQFASAALYLWVGEIVLRRRLDGEAKRANALFGVWWVVLGLVFLLAPLYSISVRILGFRDLAFAVTVVNILLVMLVGAVWGLVYYLAYVYTGSTRLFWPVTAFYVALAAGLLYVIAWRDPTGFAADGALTFAREPLAGPAAISLGLMFSLPVFTAAVAYASLFLKVRDFESRYRIGLVSGAFIVQFGWSIVSNLLQLSRRYPDSLTLTLVSNALGVLAAVGVLLAFRPPRAVREHIALPRPGGS